MKKPLHLFLPILCIVLSLTNTYSQSSTSNAFVLNGISTYAETTVHDEGDGGYNGERAKLNLNSFTVETWVKFNSTSTSASLAAIGESGYSDQISFYFTSDNKIHIYINGALGGDVFSPRFDYNFVPRLGTWYHVAFTYNATTKKVNFFINGVSQGEKTNTDKILFFLINQNCV